ncbi:MAG: N-formylglutamate amidohydrolase [Saezia sp.]
MLKTVTPIYPEPFSPLTLTLPQTDALPFIADSPHSGIKYPADFNFAIPFEILRTGENTDIDALWQAIPQVGGTLLAAEFPRSYIDPNRNADDIDISMFTTHWPKQAKPTEKSRLGAGLIWTLSHHLDETFGVYNRLLEPQEVQNRIDRYYTPYHETLNEQVHRLYTQFGCLWHLNLHSMPATAYKNLGKRGEKELADFVLGNRDDTTCSPEFIHFVAETLREKGYSVALNDPYKGVALIANIGKPNQQRHSLQVEVHRKLYMNEKTRERNDHFGQLQVDLTDVAAQIASYIKSQIK